MKEFLFGKECDYCSDLGVSCKKFGLLSVGPANSGDVLIRVDGTPALRTREGIKDCPVLLETEEKATVVEKIRDNYKKSKSAIWSDFPFQ